MWRQSAQLKLIDNQNSAISSFEAWYSAIGSFRPVVEPLCWSFVGIVTFDQPTGNCSQKHPDQTKQADFAAKSQTWYVVA